MTTEVNGQPITGSATIGVSAGNQGTPPPPAAPSVGAAGSIITGGVTPPSTPPTPTPTPAEPASWTASLPEDIRGYVELKGFKDPGTVVESYRHLEKAMGVPKERLLKLPEKSDSPEWNEIYTRLGKPAKAEEYLLSKAEGADPELAKWAEETFHGANLTRQQAEAVMGKWNSLQTEKTSQQKAAAEAARTAEVEGLKKEWGMAFETKMNISDRAAEKYGVSAEDMQKMASVLGPAKTLKLMSEIGASLGEGSFVTGSGNSSGAKTPAAAKAEINALTSDRDFYLKLSSGDVAAKEKWDSLHKYAFGS